MFPYSSGQRPLVTRHDFERFTCLTNSVAQQVVRFVAISIIASATVHVQCTVYSRYVHTLLQLQDASARHSFSVEKRLIRPGRLVGPYVILTLQSCSIMAKVTLLSCRNSLLFSIRKRCEPRPTGDIQSNLRTLCTVIRIINTSSCTTGGQAALEDAAYIDISPKPK